MIFLLLVTHEGSSLHMQQDNNDSIRDINKCILIYTHICPLLHRTISNNRCDIYIILNCVYYLVFASNYWAQVVHLIFSIVTSDFFLINIKLFLINGH